jgi:ankyrin repeat protein
MSLKRFFSEAPKTLETLFYEADDDTLHAFLSAPTTDPNELGDSELTMLTLALMYTRFEAIAILISRGAYIDRGGPDSGMTPFHNAVGYGFQDVVVLMLRQQLLSYFSIDHVDHYGNTALFYACDCDKEGCLRLLLEAGANPNVYNKNALTPLMMATQFNRHSVVAILLEYGADPDLKVFTRMLPLIHACDRGYDETARVLLKGGADKNAVVGCCNETCLMRAITNKKSAIFAMLLEVGVDIDAVTNFNDTALDVCARHEDNEAMKDALLLVHNVRTRVRLDFAQEEPCSFFKGKAFQRLDAHILLQHMERSVFPMYLVHYVPELKPYVRRLLLDRRFFCTIMKGVIPQDVFGHVAEFLCKSTSRSFLKRVLFF